MKATVLLAALVVPAAAQAAPPAMVTSSSPPAQCRDPEPVVGRASCRRYGEPWARFAAYPALQARVGYSYQRYPVSVLRFGAGAAALDLPSHQVDLSTHAVTLRLAATSGVFHVGLEGSFASDHLDREPIPGPGVQVDVTRALYLTGGVVGGVSVRLGPLVTRAEMLWGGRHTTVRLVERVHARAAEASDAAWVFEPRASLEAYLTPWIAVGLWAGVDVLSEYGRSYGLFVEGKLRAYDGAGRWPW